jgi:serine/threonine protein kinase
MTTHFPPGYEVLSSLSQGTQGVLYRVRLSDQTIVVAKVMRCDKTSAREVAIHRKLLHPNVICLRDSFEFKNRRIMVLEKGVCDLYDHTADHGTCTASPEAIAPDLFQSVAKDLIAGLTYLHSMSVCHRDLKPENIILTISGDQGQITAKLADFGLSTTFRSDKPMTTRCGTPAYVAPEVIHGSYDFRCDWWSLGVVLYFLNTGYSPFDTEDDDDDVTEIMSRVCEGIYDSTPITMGQRLIAGLLQVDPSKRSVLSQAEELL